MKFKVMGIKSHFYHAGCCMFALVLLFSGCKNQKNTGLQVYDGREEGWRALSIREKAGQVVCFNYDNEIISTFGNGSVDSLLKRYPVGSVFMASWVLSVNTPPDSLKNRYISEVQAFEKASEIPLLFAEDFETGLGETIPGYSQLPGEMALGAANNAELASNYGSVVARQARSLGINWLLHPVADLNLNPFNHLTNVRATGDNVERALKVLPSQIKAMQAQGVGATAKHFPGDGTDVTNQHFSITRMTLSVDDWKKQHGKVFQKLIEDSVMAVMAGHISFPAYQKVQTEAGFLPATLSTELMSGLLKKEMGFRGVIVSDALNMAGVTGYFPDALETAVASFTAGADVLLWPHLSVIDTIEARVKRGVIPMERLDDAVQRIWKMKLRLGVFDENYQAVRPLTEQERESDNTQAFEIAEKSVTLLHNRNNVIPIDTASSKKLMLLFISGTPLQSSFPELVQGLQNAGFEVDVRENLSYFSHGAQIPALAEKFQRIIVVFSQKPGNPWGALGYSGEPALSVWSANMFPLSKVISISFGDPYKNRIEMPRTWCRINAYNSDKNSQRAVVNILTGKSVATASSPVAFL
jgi:beta-N-acetylhexosaminidase